MLKLTRFAFAALLIGGPAVSTAQAQEAVRNMLAAQIRDVFSETADEAN